MSNSIYCNENVKKYFYSGKENYSESLLPPNAQMLSHYPSGSLILQHDPQAQILSHFLLGSLTLPHAP